MGGKLNSDLKTIFGHIYWWAISQRNKHKHTHFQHPLFSTGPRLPAIHLCCFFVLKIYWKDSFTTSSVVSKVNSSKSPNFKFKPRGTSTLRGNNVETRSSYIKNLDYGKCS